MAKAHEINVKDTAIRTMKVGEVDYICITDIARQKNQLEPNAVVGNWMRNRNTIEYLGIWEYLNNPNFNPIEFEGFKQQAGLNAFTHVAYMFSEVAAIYPITPSDPIS